MESLITTTTTTTTLESVPEVWYDKSVQRLQSSFQALDNAPLATSLEAMADLLIGFIRHESRQLPAVVSGYRELMQMADRERDERSLALAEAIAVIRRTDSTIDNMIERLTIVEQRQEQSATRGAELIAANDQHSQVTDDRLQRIEHSQADQRLTQQLILGLVFSIVLRSAYVVADGIWGTAAAAATTMCLIIFAVCAATALYVRGTWTKR